MTMVEIFAFTAYDINSNDIRLSRSMATREALLWVPGCSRQSGSSIMIDPGLLNGDGMILRTKVIEMLAGRP